MECYKFQTDSTKMEVCHLHTNVQFLKDIIKPETVFTVHTDLKTKLNKKKDTTKENDKISLAVTVIVESVI